MTRIEVLQAICAATDALEHALRPLVYSATKDAVAAVVERLEGIIDRCVREGMEPIHTGETSPCPHCGQVRCTHAQEVPHADA